MTDVSGSDPSGSDPLGLRPQQRLIFDLISECPGGLNEKEVEAKLGIDDPRRRLVEMYDAGLLYRSKPQGESLLRYTMVPPEERQQARAAASNAEDRRKAALVRLMRKAAPGAQAWVIWEILKPTTRRKKRFDASQPCAQEKGGDCDCPDANIYVQRHERRKLDVPRRQARETAAQLEREWKRIEDQVKFRKGSDPPTLYLRDVGYISQLNQIGLHLATRVEDEERIRQAFGQSEIPDEIFDEWLARMQQYREAGARIEAAIAALRREDVLDVEAVDDDDDSHGPLALTEGYDDDEIVDAEIVEDSA
jgi:hypothetical protein